MQGGATEDSGCLARSGKTWELIFPEAILSRKRGDYGVYRVRLSRPALTQQQQKPSQHIASICAGRPQLLVANLNEPIMSLFLFLI